MQDSEPSASPLDWAAVKVVFETAMDLPADARASWLASQVAAGLIGAAEFDEVSSLLAHQALADDPADALLARAPDLPLLHPGLRLGAWEIVDELGRGGMAEVWRARRADGAWEGEAAIKVLQRGMDSGLVLERFALEQRALARLAHPHIARLLDAGRSPQGQPYFVMELVHGQPIDQACAGLSIEQRLALFLQLADAVAFAHRQLLVHRDLKPSNVMVTPEGQVKLLDFGIAKALDPLEGGVAAADLTQAGQRPYTPNYASPEQARGEWVGTGTDIYSLGVLLYVMLTGLRPYGRQASTPQEAVRSLLEEDPTRPSALSPQEVPDPNWLHTRKHLRGDLDNILLKALEKAPERRYVSVDAFADDVHAYLEDRPVSARAAGWAYLAGKFVVRYRWPVGLSTLAALSLVAVASVALWQAHRAEQRLAAVKSLTREAVFHFGDAVTYVPGGMTVKADLLAQLTSVLDRLAQASSDDVDLRADAAQAYARLADIELNDTSNALHRTEAGRVHAERALSLGREVLPAKMDDAEFLVWYWRALASRARAQRMEGHPQQALQTLEPVLPLLNQAILMGQQAQRDDVVMTLRVERARLHHLLSQLYFKPGSAHVDKAQEALAELALARTELLELNRLRHHSEILYLLGSVDGAESLIQEARDQLPQALEAGERALQIRRAVVAELPDDVEYRDALVTEALNLGKVLLRLQRPADALATTTLSWDTNAQLEREHPANADNAWTRRRPSLAVHHGRALRRAGQAAAALPVLQMARAYALEQESAGNPDARRWRVALDAEWAQALLAQRQAPAALAVAQHAWQLGDPASLAGSARRAMLLARAEAALAAASACPQACQLSWHQLAAASLDEAAALAPLAGEHASWRQDLRRR